MKFIFRDGKIATLYSPRKSDEAKAADQSLDQLTLWAAKNRFEEWAKVYKVAECDKFVDPAKTGTLTARQMGESLSAICAAYAASLKATPAP